MWHNKLMCLLQLLEHVWRAWGLFAQSLSCFVLHVWSLLVEETSWWWFAGVGCAYAFCLWLLLLARTHLAAVSCALALQSRMIIFRRVFSSPGERARESEDTDAVASRGQCRTLIKTCMLWCCCCSSALQRRSRFLFMQLPCGQHTALPGQTFAPMCAACCATHIVRVIADGCLLQCASLVLTCFSSQFLPCAVHQCLHSHVQPVPTSGPVSCMMLCGLPVSSQADNKVVSAQLVSGFIGGFLPGHMLKYRFQHNAWILPLQLSVC